MGQPVLWPIMSGFFFSLRCAAAAYLSCCHIKSIFFQTFAFTVSIYNMITIMLVHLFFVYCLIIYFPTMRYFFLEISMSICRYGGGGQPKYQMKWPGIFQVFQPSPQCFVSRHDFLTCPPVITKKMPKMSSNLQGSFLKSLFSPPPFKVASWEATLLWHYSIEIF